MTAALQINRRVITGAGLAWASGLAATGRARAAGGAEPLVVWFTVEGAKAVRAIAARFTAETGIPVVVETPDDAAAKFQQAAAAGKGPDLFIHAHDRIGEWVAGGLIHAVSPGRALVDDQEPLAWQGFTLRGRRWGYPLAVEAVTLVYNRALVATPPASFDEVLALDAALRPQGRRAILWDYTNAYFSWPLLAANGGYAFRQRPDGSFDVRDSGVNHPGAVQGAALIDRLLRDGLMPRGSGYAEMEAAMAQGRVAMMINGPWSWVNLRRLGIDFGIARIPRVGQRPAVPFVGIKGLLINRATRQREAVVELVENHLLTLPGLRALNAAEPLGAPANRRYLAELGADPRIAGVMDSARDGLPTPSVAEMGRFWSAMKSSLQTLSEGRQTPQQALDAAARRVNQA